MCHPEDYNAWVNAITAELRGGGGGGGAAGGKGGNVVEGPGLRLPVMQVDGGESCCRGGAGHSGAMRLAASLVKDLLRHRRLERLLGWGAGFGADESAPGGRQPGSEVGSQGSGWLPSVRQWTMQRSLRRSASAASYRCGPTTFLAIASACCARAYAGCGTCTLFCRSCRIPVVVPPQI